ncbi:MAG: glycosyltransferase [Bacteroidota bacterium]
MKKLLVIAHVWPEPRSSAAGSRIVHLLGILEGEFEHITLVSVAGPGPFSHDFSASHIHCVQVKLNDPAFDALLSDLQPDAVLFDRFMVEEQFGWRVREQVPGAMTILDTEDLHFLRQARGEAVRKKLDFTDEFLYSDTAKREIASILRCDLSLVISETEQQILVEKMQVPASLLYYLPLLVDEIPKNDPGFGEREHFVFIGNGLHKPNADAIRVLKQEIWPRIRKQLPRAELHIYGAYLPGNLLQLHKPAEGFYVLGRAEEVAPVMNKARVFLAPLRFGAGQKGKLLEAMCHNLPNVSTSIAAESMPGELAWSGAISDSWDEFAAAAVGLHTDEKHWNVAARQGKIIVEARFMSGLFREKLAERIRDICQNLARHRRRHFIGQILAINTLNSYKYLSRWIEAKNSK